MAQFKNLIFEGGGVKGIAYAGAIKVLSQRKMLQSVERVAGTSAGAITATLLALGAEWNDISAIVGGTNFRKFMDDSWGLSRDVKRVIRDYGWFKGDTFSKWIKKQIKSLTGRKELTFSSLEALKNKDKKTFCSLYLAGTNLSLQTPEIFSAETTPKMKIWKAVRISMSIPLFFASVEDDDGDIHVDGGVSYNYPLDLFDEKKYLSHSKNTKLYKAADYPTTRSAEHIYNKETLGFRVDTKDEIKAGKDNWRVPPKAIDNFVDYAKALLGFMMDMANKSHLHHNDWDRTVFIDALGVGGTDFDLSDAKVKALIKSGEDGAKAYFRWFDNPGAKPRPKNKI